MIKLKDLRKTDDIIEGDEIMDKFMSEIIELINEEAERRAEKIIDKEAEKRAKKLIDKRVDGIIKNLSTYLSISDIATVTQLTTENVRACLQEIVDLYNNINKMGNEAYIPETVETYFDLKKFKHNRNKEEKA
ncbi:MAG: hypothetical protein F8N39_19680 [Clostridiaceae bacterium]|nr:hypothetical protein [Clostridiaceae bacterium]